VKDHKSRQERDGVGHQVGRAHEGQPLDRAKAHRQGQVMCHARRGREEDDRPGRDQPERKGLLEQMRPARSFPCPAAQHVTHDSTGEPGGGRGNCWPHVHGEAGKKRDFARGERHRGTEGEPGEAPAHGADAVGVHCPDYAVQVHRPSYSAQRRCHGYLSLRVVVTDNSGSNWAPGQEPTAEG
jgi:hypothetical protein